MELVDTTVAMNSDNYKERFKAEYYQVKIRYEKLKAMCDKWDEGRLDFTPTCDRGIYTRQLNIMRNYMELLEYRAKKEDVEL